MDFRILEESGEGRRYPTLTPATHTPNTSLGMGLCSVFALSCSCLGGGTMLNVVHGNTIRGHAYNSKASKLMNLPKFVEFGARI